MLNALDPSVTLLDPGLPVCFSYSVVGVSLPPLFGVGRHCQGCCNRYGFGGDCSLYADSEESGKEARQPREALRQT